jgi:hypothetical protein
MFWNLILLAALDRELNSQTTQRQRIKLQFSFIAERSEVSNIKILVIRAIESYVIANTFQFDEKGLAKFLISYHCDVSLRKATNRIGSGIPGQVLPFYTPAGVCKMH